MLLVGLLVSFRTRLRRHERLIAVLVTFDGILGNFLLITALLNANGHPVLNVGGFKKSED